MNTKTAIGIIIAIVILVGAFFLLHKPVAAPALPPAAVGTSTPTQGAPTTTPLSAIPTASSDPHKPSVTVGTPKPVLMAAFDQGSLVSTSMHPALSGTANTNRVGIVVDNAQGVGIVGSSDVPVANGKWSYTVPLGLNPGTYTVHLLGGDKEVKAQLVVTR